MDQDARNSLNQINKDIKKEYKSLRNRLQSIVLDYRFLSQEVVPHFPDYPLIPNERCGLWYCNPEDYEQTSYFKSTDGHINQWDFSTRRLNFHLLPTIKDNGGIIIVDSTRRGKKIPDALSKTVPIWCAVLNMLMLDSQKEMDTGRVLFVPPTSVTPSECDRIKKTLPKLVEKVKQLDVIDGQQLYEQFGGKILRPFWVYPGSHLLKTSTDPFTGDIIEEISNVPDNEKIIPIILCTVSYRSQDGVDKRHGFTYVQGAADDHELWSCGLEPEMFWSHQTFLGDQNNSEEQLIKYTSSLIAKKRENSEELGIQAAFQTSDRITLELSLGQIVSNLEIGPTLLEKLQEMYSLVIVLSASVTLASTIPKEKAVADFIKVYPLESGSKRSSRDLRIKLPELYPLIEGKLRSPIVKKKPILICCNSATDMSIGVLLVVLSKNYRADWTLEPSDSINKIIIRKHLTKLISKLQGRNVNPSRATLNSVNSFLI